MFDQRADQVVGFIPGTAPLEQAEGARESPALAELPLELFGRDGQVDEAVSIYQKILQVDPANAYANYLLGGVLYQQGKWRDSADLLEKAFLLKGISLSIKQSFCPACLQAGGSKCGIFFTAVKRIEEQKDAVETVCVTPGPIYLWNS